MEYEKDLFDLPQSTLSHSQNYVPILVAPNGVGRYADDPSSLHADPLTQHSVVVESTVDISTGSTVVSGNRVYLLIEQIHRIRERWNEREVSGEEEIETHAISQWEEMRDENPQIDVIAVKAQQSRLRNYDLIRRIGRGRNGEGKIKNGERKCRR
jgi:hypothetical protein